MNCDEIILWLEVSPPPRDLFSVDHHQFSLETADHRPPLINSVRASNFGPFRNLYSHVPSSNEHQKHTLYVLVCFQFGTQLF